MKKYHQQQTEELCEILAWHIAYFIGLHTALPVSEWEQFGREHLCRFLASPMSSALIRYYTNISFPLPQYILSMADLLELAMRSQLQARKERGNLRFTSAGVIKSAGFVHCVALVTVL